MICKVVPASEPAISNQLPALSTPTTFDCAIQPKWLSGQLKETFPPATANVRFVGYAAIVDATLRTPFAGLNIQPLPFASGGMMLA